MALATVSAIAPVGAFATDYDAEGNAQTDVTWTSNAAYTVTIPATVALGQTATISASDVNLNTGEQLNVTLSGTSDAENAFKLTTATDSLTYTVSKGDDNVAVGDVVLNVAAGTQTGSSILAFNEPATTPNAGDYTGTVTFTVSVESAAVAVTGVTLNNTTLELTAIGDTATLNATVSPDDATDKTVTWESSDTAIATVDETGKVTAVGAGEATITAKAGDVTATCSVNSLGCSKASYTISASSSKPISFDNGNVTYTSSGSYIISKNATNKFTANGGRKIYKIVLSGKSIESRSSGTGWSNGTWSSSEGAAEVTFNTNWNYNNNSAGIGLTMTVYYK